MKELTKQMLINLGITVIKDDSVKYGYIIRRTWNKNSSKELVTRDLTINEAVCKHKYTNEKRYPIVTFSAYGKTYSCPLSRIVYAYLKGTIPANYDVDHIDNNQFNNELDNLQLLTRKENLAKRLADNSLTKWPNQYTCNKEVK